MGVFVTTECTSTPYRLLHVEQFEMNGIDFVQVRSGKAHERKILPGLPRGVQSALARKASSYGE